MGRWPVRRWWRRVLGIAVVLLVAVATSGCTLEVATNLALTLPDDDTAVVTVEPTVTVTFTGDVADALRDDPSRVERVHNVWRSTVGGDATVAGLDGGDAVTFTSPVSQGALTDAADLTGLSAVVADVDGEIVRTQLSFTQPTALIAALQASADDAAMLVAARQTTLTTVVQLPDGHLLRRDTVQGALELSSDDDQVTITTTVADSTGGHVTLVSGPRSGGAGIPYLVGGAVLAIGLGVAGWVAFRRIDTPAGG